MTDNTATWREAILPLEATLAEAIKNLNATGLKLVLCTHPDGRLYGTVSDGDLRRGLLRGLSMEDQIVEIANPRPLVVPSTTDRDMVRALMKANKVLQIPAVDDKGSVVDLHLWNALDTPQSHDHLMVIMAGGKGTRLRPYTENCPKPMLPIAGKPMLEHIIERARGQGFSRFLLTLNYLGEMVRDHFGDGSDHDVRIDYVTETEPLGTAGALSLLDPVPDSAFVVTNGDVLTDIDYHELILFRAQHDAKGVMAVRQYEMRNPFGVVMLDGIDITGFVEKPASVSHINAGVYAFAPSALSYLEKDTHCDMPGLFERLRAAHERVVAFPMHEPWLDVGRPDDLKLANSHMADGES